MGSYLAYGKVWIIKAPVRKDKDMAKTINEIKTELKAATIDTLPFFVEEYTPDQRSGVQALVKKALQIQEKHKQELLRLEAMKAYEQQYKDCTYICGIDEAGRGPLAGPVVAGAVILPKDVEILYLNDSKKLSAAKREELYEEIKEKAIAAEVGIVEPERIDEINILQATYEAMRIAIKKLPVTPDILLNDAVTIPEITIPQVPIIKGDAKSVSIAAASIMAKVTRDRIMEAYDKEYPQYGFAAHKGYGAEAHYAALDQYGICPIHRRSFLKKYMQNK